MKFIKNMFSFICILSLGVSYYFLRLLSSDVTKNTHFLDKTVEFSRKKYAKIKEYKKVLNKKLKNLKGEFMNV